MCEEDILKKVVDIVVVAIDVKEGNVCPTLNAEDKFSDLGLDSLDVMDIIVQVEQEMSVNLDWAPFPKTIQNLVDAIKMVY